MNGLSLHVGCVCLNKKNMNVLLHWQYSVCPFWASVQKQYSLHIILFKNYLSVFWYRLMQKVLSFRAGRSTTAGPSYLLQWHLIIHICNNNPEHYAMFSFFSLLNFVSITIDRFGFCLTLPSYSISNAADILYTFFILVQTHLFFSLFPFPCF